MDALESITDNKISLILHAFFIGFRFDTLVSFTILSLPALIGGIAFLFNFLSTTLLRFLYLFTAIGYTLAFMICAVDIPFFNHFFKRLNDTIFIWNNAGGFAFKMVLQEPGFYSFFIIFLVLILSFFWIIKKVAKKHIEIVVSRKRTLYYNISLLLFLYSILFIGMRGRVEKKSPMIAGTAFFSTYPFINQLGLNPVYTFIHSFLDKSKSENNRLNWIDDKIAIHEMRDEFSCDSSDIDCPLIRQELSVAPFEGSNVVLVIMESMAAHRMKRYGNTEKLTPYLDSLSSRSLVFDSTFSAGIHTFNGIYATLFANPALMKRHSLDQLTVPKMFGFSNVLKKKGYQNIFFTTHDELFDNMSGFLLANDFETIIGEKDYPSSEVKSALGVPDEYMFRFAIPKLNALSKKGSPFFAAFMTGSNHDPHIIPENTGFKKRHEESSLAVIEYSDWSVQQFMSYASKQSWYNNTVFVFVADHGVPLWNDTYDIPFSFHHIPFFIYAPGKTEPQEFKKLALQTDVFPTVMSMIAKQYQNNTFGINLFTQQHKDIVFSSDDVLACMNDSLLYIYRSGRNSSLYKYRNNDKNDYIEKLPQLGQRMSTVAFSWLQTSQWMISQPETR
ncbi:LTA synthase family protein [Flavobacterium sp. UBA7682]|uniref:LTA synthase family protein n=1 Tax=Flavobacterium sp. UBA7682 TaxID=1946560 RepID=UPI0025BE0041|nr:alkaline phosphatase family protein [Flavobacterium sp. UBA7682]